MKIEQFNVPQCPNQQGEQVFSAPESRSYQATPVQVKPSECTPQYAPQHAEAPTAATWVQPEDVEQHMNYPVPHHMNRPLPQGAQVFSAPECPSYYATPVQAPSSESTLQYAPQYAEAPTAATPWMQPQDVERHMKYPVPQYVNRPVEIPQSQQVPNIVIVQEILHQIPVVQLPVQIQSQTTPTLLSPQGYSQCPMCREFCQCPKCGGSVQYKPAGAVLVHNAFLPPQHGGSSVQLQLGGGSVQFQPGGASVQFEPGGGSVQFQPHGGSVQFQPYGCFTQPLPMATYRAMPARTIFCH
mmetsp:Transcript_37551/g.74575  ORF Transcript_37551/g.74575 Transcript_37551/m.74575 type:complete len:298 (+) Transcript_37551:84-977(+)